MHELYLNVGFFPLTDTDVVLTNTNETLYKLQNHADSARKKT